MKVNLGSFILRFLKLIAILLLTSWLLLRVSIDSVAISDNFEKGLLIIFGIWQICFWPRINSSLITFLVVTAFGLSSFSPNSGELLLGFLALTLTPSAFNGRLIKPVPVFVFIFSIYLVSRGLAGSLQFLFNSRIMELWTLLNPIQLKGAVDVLFEPIIIWIVFLVFWFRDVKSVLNASSVFKVVVPVVCIIHLVSFLLFGELAFAIRLNSEYLVGMTLFLGFLGIHILKRNNKLWPYVVALLVVCLIPLSQFTGSKQEDFLSQSLPLSATLEYGTLFGFGPLFQPTLESINLSIPQGMLNSLPSDLFWYFYFGGVVGLVGLVILLISIILQGRKFSFFNICLLFTSVCLLIFCPGIFITFEGILICGLFSSTTRQKIFSYKSLLPRHNFIRRGLFFFFLTLGVIITFEIGVVSFKIIRNLERLKSEPKSVEVTKEFVELLLIKEDRFFFYHRGFDPGEISRSFFENLKHGKYVRGASTISMQLAKILFLSNSKTIRRKIQQCLITVFLEAVLSKEEILYKYITNVDFGSGIIGVEKASRHFFGKKPSDLSERQSALLVLMFQDPRVIFNSIRTGRPIVNRAEVLLFRRNIASLDIIRMPHMEFVK